MGYHRLPSVGHYWSTEPDLAVSFISNIMPRDRFKTIRKQIHFNNKELEKARGEEGHDRLCKVRPLLNHVNEAFQSALSPEEYQSIDERMIKFKGPNILKQYVKSKPIKWGFKAWVRAGSHSGYVFEIDLYTGRKPNEKVEVGLGEGVILDLSRNLKQMNCCIAMDNFFMSVRLAHTLHSIGIRCIGTVRAHRKNLPKDLTIDKNMNKGEIDKRQTTDGKLHLVKFMDTRAVTVLSNFETPHNIVQVKRRRKGEH